MIKGKVIVAGDVHGDFSALNELLNKEQPEILIQLGDFGYWPRTPDYTKHLIKNKETKIYWCDGNHEDFESLRLNINGKKEPQEIRPNIFYMPRGTTLTLPDGRNTLFVGGADSIDKMYRQIGINWFAEEILLPEEVCNIDPATKVDIVFSHTAPNEFDIKGTLDMKWFGDKIEDPSRKALSYVLETFNPPLWYFGHWHHHKRGQYKDCKWTALDHTYGGQTWWLPLT